MISESVRAKKFFNVIIKKNLEADIHSDICADEIRINYKYVV